MGVATCKIAHMEVHPYSSKISNVKKISLSCCLSLSSSMYVQIQMGIKMFFALIVSCSFKVGGFHCTFFSFFNCLVTETYLSTNESPPHTQNNGCYMMLNRGKKITCPGAQDKLNFMQDKHIFSPNVWRTSKKLTASIFFLDKDKLFGNRTSKKFDVVARGTSEIF